MDKIEKIRQEIERRRLHFNKEAEKYQALNYGYSQNCYGARDALRDIENFLDTLSEEPDKSMEEAAEEYSKSVSNGHNYRDLICGFKAGAEWQKSQMLKDAIHYVAQPDIATGNIQMPFVRIGFQAFSKYGVKVGDKVKIIIVPEKKDKK